MLSIIVKLLLFHYAIKYLDYTFVKQIHLQ